MPFNQLYRLICQYFVPTFVFREKAVAVVHLDFVEMCDDVQVLRLQHLECLLPKSSDRSLDVIAEQVAQAVVVYFLLGTVNEPKSIAMGRPHKMHTTDDVVEIISRTPNVKILGNTWNKFAFQ